MTTFGTSWPLAWEAHRNMPTRDACLHWIIEEATMAGHTDWADEAQGALDTGDNEDLDCFVRWCAKKETEL